MSLLVLVPTEPEHAGLVATLPAGQRLELCGLGLPAAALGAARALASGAVSHCLLVGIAGTRDPDRAPLGSVVSGTAVRNEAVGAGQGEAFVALGDMGLGAGLSVPPDCLELTPWLAEGLVPGVIGTVAAASATPAEAATRRRMRPDVLVEEMEGHAVALACREAGVPLSILRAVSNVAGERGRRAWDIDGALAALAAVLGATLGERARS